MTSHLEEEYGEMMLLSVRSGLEKRGADLRYWCRSPFLGGPKDSKVPPLCSLVPVLKCTYLVSIAQGFGSL